MKIRILAAVLPFIISAPALSQNDAQSTLNATVLTQDGVKIADAYVLLHDYQAPGHGQISENWETRTQADGSSSVVVEPRCYDLFVSKGAMLPYSQRICVGPQPMSKLKIKLQADPHPRLMLQ
jgi:hypothetical protein